MVLVTLITAVAAMAVVHENVHQRAGEQKQEGQCEEEVGTVFGEQKIQRNSAEKDQPDGIARAPEACGSSVGLGMVVVH